MHRSVFDLHQRATSWATAPHPAQSLLAKRVKTLAGLLRSLVPVPVRLAVPGVPAHTALVLKAYAPRLKAVLSNLVVAAVAGQSDLLTA